MRSTGHVDLNRKSLLALKQWRWKPGNWSQVDVLIVFVAGGLVYFPSEADPCTGRRRISRQPPAALPGHDLATVAATLYFSNPLPIEWDCR